MFWQKLPLARYPTRNNDKTTNICENFCFRRVEGEGWPAQPEACGNEHQTQYWTCDQLITSPKRYRSPHRETMRLKTKRRTIMKNPRIQQQQQQQPPKVRRETPTRLARTERRRHKCAQSGSLTCGNTHGGEKRDGLFQISVVLRGQTGTLCG